MRRIGEIVGDTSHRSALDFDATQAAGCFIEPLRANVAHRCLAELAKKSHGRYRQAASVG
jgi:hypothetical protein